MYIFFHMYCSMCNYVRPTLFTLLTCFQVQFSLYTLRRMYCGACKFTTKTAPLSAGVKVKTSGLNRPLYVRAKSGRNTGTG